jgi:D-glycero-alpha-D-manno-heptose-7-phosphate kinase
MFIVKAPMRLSFAGGGSDLPSYLIHEAFGKTLTTTINKFVYVTINTSSSNYYRFVYSAIEECLIPDEISHSILKQLFLRHTPKEPIELFSIADLPARGTGLGASSAFCLAAVAALTRYNSLELDNKLLAAEASHIEMKMCGNASGFQDQFASALGGIALNTFSLHGLEETHDLLNEGLIGEDTLSWLNEHLVFVRVGGDRDSNSILKTINFEESKVLELQKAIVEMVDEFSAALAHKNLPLMGNLMDHNWELKKTISPQTTSTKIDSLYFDGKRCGAFGGKLLGAGGSGYFLFIVENVNDFLSRMNLSDSGIRVTGKKLEVLEV